MLFVAALGWATLQLGRFLLPPLLPELRADLGLTLGQTGVVLSLFQGVYALFQYPSGRLSDRLSRATLVLPGLVVLAAAFLLVGAATTYPALLLAAAVIGLGKGLYATPARALLSDLFVERRGRALGVFSAGTDLGGVVASVLAVLAIRHATWRAPFLPVAVVLGLLAVLYALWTRDDYVLRPARLGVTGTVRRVLATPRQRRTVAAYALFFVVVNGVVNFLPAYLREAKGFSAGLASAAFAFLFLLGMGVKPASGALSDRVPRRTVAAAGLVLGAAALAALVLAGSVVGVGLAVVALAVGYKAQFPVVDALLLDAAPADSAGGDLGAARGLFFAVGSIGPSYVGIVAGARGYPLAFAGLVGCLLAAAALVAAPWR
jgi:MFS family permease